MWEFTSQTLSRWNRPLAPQARSDPYRYGVEDEQSNPEPVRNRLPQQGLGHKADRRPQDNEAQRGASAVIRGDHGAHVPTQNGVEKVHPQGDGEVIQRRLPHLLPSWNKPREQHVGECDECTNCQIPSDYSHNCAPHIASRLLGFQCSPHCPRMSVIPFVAPTAIASTFRACTIWSPFG